MLKIDIEMYRNVVGNKLGSAGLLTFLGNLGGLPHCLIGGIDPPENHINHIML